MLYSPNELPFDKSGWSNDNPGDPDLRPIHANLKLMQSESKCKNLILVKKVKGDNNQANLP